MKLTSLSAAPRGMEAPPRAPARRMDGRTGSQLIRGVDCLLEQAMRSIWFRAFVLAGVVTPAVAQVVARFEDLAQQFVYERKAPLEIRTIGRSSRQDVSVIDLTYASPLGGRVPAYLVVPAGKGPFAAVLFGHWMMEGSPLRNRREFLEEAVVLARAGAVSLLIDAPLVRPGFVAKNDELSAWEKRIGSFVLMAATFADEEYVFDPCFCSSAETTSPFLKDWPAATTTCSLNQRGLPSTTRVTHSTGRRGATGSRGWWRGCHSHRLTKPPWRVFPS